MVGGDNALIEMLPIPLMNSYDDTYQNVFNEFILPLNDDELKQLSKKNDYINYCLYNKPNRVDFLKNKVSLKKDGIIVFYDKEMFQHILTITETISDSWKQKPIFVNPIDKKYIGYCKSKDRPLYVLVEHPARYKEPIYWDTVAHLIKNLIHQQSLILKNTSKTFS